MRPPFVKLQQEESLKTLRLIAKSNLDSYAPQHYLRRWWCTKYQMPPTSREFLEYTPEELWVEFFEDFYAKNPDADLDKPGKDDDVQFTNSGDPGVDKVEALLAADVLDEKALMAELESWEAPKQSSKDREALLNEAYRRSEDHRKQVDSIGDGFEDVAPGKR